MPTRPRYLLCLALALFGGMVLLWPGDIPWVNDEPNLLMQALTANREHRLAVHGIMGSRGVTYGPVPIWFYQAALSLTHRLPPIAAVKAALSFGVCLLAIAVLLRRTRLFSATVLLLCAASPYLYLYHRMLWDNVLMLPLSALLLVATERCLRAPSAESTATAAALAALLLHIHPISITLVAAVTLVIGIARRQWFRTHRRTAVLTLAGLALAAAAQVWIAVKWACPAPPTPYSLAATYHWLLGGVFFSHVGLDHRLGPGWYQILPTVLRWPVRGLIVVSGTGIVVTLGGGALAANILVRAWRRHRWSSRQQLLAVALLAVGLQGALQVTLPLRAEPHYFNAVWPCYALFLGLGLRFLCHRRWGRVLGCILLAANCLLLPVLAGFIHWQQGNQLPSFGPALSNQIAIARQLDGYSRDSHLDAASVLNYRLFPEALTSLLELYCDPRPPSTLPRCRLTLQPEAAGSYPGRLRLRVDATPELDVAPAR